MNQRSLRSGIFLIFLLSTLSACMPANFPVSSLPSAPSGTPVVTFMASALPTHGLEITAIPNAAFTPTPEPTETLVPTAPSTTTPSPTITLTPEPVILRGTVLEHSNCRYGPGPVFLYKYGILPTSYMEVIGRDEAGTWLLIRAIGGDNPCWLKASLMDVQGNVLNVREVDPDIILAWSPYYPALTGVSASRNGTEVSVFWDPLILKAGDDSLQTPYVIEAWVCTSGTLTFTVVGSWATSARINDEPGCSEPSHGRVYGAEKHGYTRWVEIPWPP